METKMKMKIKWAEIKNGKFSDEMEIMEMRISSGPKNEIAAFFYVPNFADLARSEKRTYFCAIRGGRAPGDFGITRGAVSFLDQKNTPFPLRPRGILIFSFVHFYFHFRFHFPRTPPVAAPGPDK